MNPLHAISPIDGRYRKQTEALSLYFSEYAIIRYRVRVEIDYFIALCRIPLPPLAGIPEEKLHALASVAANFSDEDALRIKEKEAVINHDVKAVEYFVKDSMQALGLDAYTEFIHFGLTSQDINNTAFPMAVKAALHEVYLPQARACVAQIKAMAQAWKTVPMLAHTHGQPASPTLVGKELAVFVARLETQLASVEQIPVCGKFGGATGNFNAHCLAYPQVDWQAFATQLLHEKFHLDREFPTTQIEHYDNLAALFQALSRVNTICIDLCRDMWTYISMEYFRQRVNTREVGSSAMPHKVNPIDFENAEGNLGVANALFTHLAAKLPISRLQRDLTDSTVIRNMGVPLAHTVLAFRSLSKGLGKVELNEKALQRDLDANWAVLAEAIQTLLRREGFPHPYETLKALTRTGEHITRETLRDFILSLPVSEDLKQEMLSLTPASYTGLPVEI